MVIKKFVHFFRVVRQNGGVWKSLKALYIRDDLKDGVFVGEDDYGNKYYENSKYFMPRDRWVNYADHVQLNYDASQVPAEWFGWLHHRTDLPPFQDPTRPKYSWMAPHTENMTGTNEQFVPYTTTMPKIHAWKPPRPGEICPKKPSGEKKQETSCEDIKQDPCCDRSSTVFH